MAALRNGGPSEWRAGTAGFEAVIGRGRERKVKGQGIDP